MVKREIVAIGASAGGISALKSLTAALPADLPAIVVIVQHLAAQSPRLLPEILGDAGPLPAAFAVDGEEPHHGRIYVAPPDRHLLVDAGRRLRLSRGPRENRARPAVDPTFRSVALAYGPSAVGVILSGYLDDGASGLKAIELAGGTCLAQDPADAEVADMPRAALRHVKSARSESLLRLGPLIASLVATPVEEKIMPGRTAREIEIEAAIAAGDRAALAGTSSLGRPSALTCPDCHGTLFEIGESSLERFRCHTGHAFTSDALLGAVRMSTENALWSAVRALQEEAILFEHIARHAEAWGDVTEAAELRENAKRAKVAADHVRAVEQEGEA